MKEMGKHCKRIGLQCRKPWERTEEGRGVNIDGEELKEDYISKNLRMSSM